MPDSETHRSTVATNEAIWRQLDALRADRQWIAPDADCSTVVIIETIWHQLDVLRAERKEIARILREYVDAPLSIPHVQALQDLSARLNPETYVRDGDARD